MGNRLYIIGRSDLKPGLRAAQLVHVGIDFAGYHGPALFDWEVDGGVLVLLEVPGMAELEALQKRAFNTRGIWSCAFYETDLDNQLTGVALYGDGASELVRDLPLAFNGPTCQRIL